MPTLKFERMVESIEISPSFKASLRSAFSVIARSRIGFPYLCSPICRNGVSAVA